MNAADALSRLAACAGIQPEYTDAWGEQHRVSAATQKALLAAMGLPAQTDTQIRASLDRQLEHQRRLLPPTSVVRRGEPVSVVVPEPPPDGLLRWQLQTEDGAEYAGEVATEALPVQQNFTIADAPYTRRALPCTAELPWGYHSLRMWLGDREGATQLIVVPERAWQPPAFEGGRRWGLSVQLYGLRSARNWGIGDFTDLTALIAGAGRLGAAVVGVNPLHALFPGRPEDASPYSPSGRLFLNPLYLDVEAIPEFTSCAPARARVTGRKFQTRASALRAGSQVDYTAVADLKWPILELLYEHFHALAQAEPAHPRRAQFQAFQRTRGWLLRRFATFNALAEAHRTADWREWPASYRNPDSPTVEAFINSHHKRIEFHEYVQWQADLQFGSAAAAAREHGLEIGIYADLAVGASPHGAEAWGMQHAVARGVSIGAPPDTVNLLGQNWGLPPQIPMALQQQAYAPFIALLRANMAHVGALRIDHALGLMRLYWLPDGAKPTDGAYVGYPFRELVGLLALESHRNRCLVIGEDLGTVPPGLREALSAAGILSYQLLSKQADGNYRPSAAYPANALVSAGTHDRPTLLAFWAGDDIELRARLGLWPSPAQQAAATETRQRDRAALSAALHQEGLLVDARAPEQAPVEATYRYLARTPCKLLMVQSEDVLGQREQVNVPGTVFEHPNWRQRLPVPLEEVFAAPLLRRLAVALNESRERCPNT